MIDTNTQIRLVDKQTGKTLIADTYKHVKQLRARANRMDQQYGAIRYIVAIDWDTLQA